MLDTSALAEPRQVNFSAWLRGVLAKAASVADATRAARAEDAPPALPALEVACLCHGGGG